MLSASKFFTLNATSLIPASISPALRTTSCEKLKPGPVWLSESTRPCIASRASRSFHCAVAIENRRSLYERTVPPEFTRMKMSSTVHRLDPFPHTCAGSGWNALPGEATQHLDSELIIAQPCFGEVAHEPHSGSRIEYFRDGKPMSRVVGLCLVELLACEKPEVVSGRRRSAQLRSRRSGTGGASGSRARSRIGRTSHEQRKSREDRY